MEKMLINIFCFILYLNYLEPYVSTAPQYQYLGVKSTNQMEPPSLESMGSIEGQYQHNHEMGGGQARSMGSNGENCQNKQEMGGGQSRSLYRKRKGGIAGGLIGGLVGGFGASEQSSSNGRQSSYGGGMIGGIGGGLVFGGTRSRGNRGQSSGGAVLGGGLVGGFGYGGHSEVQQSSDGGMAMAGMEKYYPHKPGCDKKHPEEKLEKKKCWRKSNVAPKQRKLCNTLVNKGRPRSLEVLQDSDIKMIEREKKETPMKEVAKLQMQPIEGEAVEKDLKDNTREAIETFTEKYIVTSVMTRTYTRKRLFVQKRKVVNQKIIKPVVIIRRKVIKERQLFERIIPKIIETREVINHPSIKSKVVEGPIIEISTKHPCDDYRPPQPPQPPIVRMIYVPMPPQPPPEPETTPCPPPPPPTEEDCPEVLFDPNSGETVDAEQTVYGSDTGYGYLG